MARLYFQQNYNKKLDCNCFTTIRLDSDIYYEGAMFDVFFKNEMYKKVIVRQVKRFTIDQLNEFMSAVDMGLTVPECVKVMKNMWAKEIIDWEKQKFAFVLLRTLK